MTFDLKHEELWFLIGTCLMLISLIYFSILLYRIYLNLKKNNKNDKNDKNDEINNEKHNQNKQIEEIEKRNFYKKLLATIVVFLAFISYLGMLLVSIYASHNEVTLIRYFEWMITTPLLLIDLALLAMLVKQRIYTLILLDVLMIGLGLAAVYSLSIGMKSLFFILSTLCMFGIFYILLTPENNMIDNPNINEKQKKDLIQKSKNANIYTITIWTIYPIIWLIGLHGFQYINIPIETLCYLILDFLAKPMFAFLFVF